MSFYFCCLLLFCRKTPVSTNIAMNNLCPSNAWISRTVLVASNTAFLIPAIYLTILTAKKCLQSTTLATAPPTPSSLTAVSPPDLEANLLPSVNATPTLHTTLLPAAPLPLSPKFLVMMSFVPDILTLLTLFLSSVFYHLCFDSYDCTRQCFILATSDLKDADFIMAFQTLGLAVIWTRTVDHLNIVVLKTVIAVVLFSFNVLGYLYIAGNTVSNASASANVTTYYIVLGVILVLATVTKFMMFWKQSLHELVACRKWSFVLCIIFAAVGLYFQLSIGPMVDDSEPVDYWWRHSLWHTCLGLSLFFRFYS